MISYGLHDLYLCAKACYVMSSFLQQAAEIHGFTARNKLSKLVASVHMNRILRSGGLVTSHDNPFIFLLHQLRVPHPVPKLEKKSSAPIHPRPNRTSHGGISCQLYPLAPLTDFLFTWWWTGSLLLFDLREGSEKSASKLDPTWLGVQGDSTCGSSSTRTHSSHNKIENERVKKVRVLVFVRSIFVVVGISMGLKILVQDYKQLALTEITSLMGLRFSFWRHRGSSCVIFG